MSHLNPDDFLVERVGPVDYDEHWDEIGEVGRWHNREGEPVTLRQWVNLCLDPDYRRVGDTEVNGYRVSTVLLGLDHQWGDGPPLIFETMVFEEGSFSDLECVRYSTLSEAEEGHKKMVEKVKRMKPRK